MPLDPPKVKMGPSRSRRNRRRDPYEVLRKPKKLTRYGREVKCKTCHNLVTTNEHVLVRTSPTI